MKKLFTIILILCVAFQMTACNAETEVTETATETEVSTQETATETEASTQETATETEESTQETATETEESTPETATEFEELTQETATETEESTPETATESEEFTPETATESKELTQETTSESEEETSDGIFINKTTQKISLIINGECICEGDCVTGTKGSIYDTPTGVFDIDARITNTTLTDGETYWADVDYWLPFEGDIGIHDASWRSNFGGCIYETDGSHGCVNVPLYVAEAIYENSYIGLTVYVE